MFCSSQTTVFLLQKLKKKAEHFLTSAVLIMAVTLHTFSMTILVCPNTRNRCKPIVTHFMLEVTDLIVGWVGVWPQEEKIMEESRN
jgi:hypothetical protein